MTTPSPSARRPPWITILIVLTLFSVASDLWEASQRIADSPEDFALSLLQSVLLLSSAIGLWGMKKWGGVTFLLGVMTWLLLRLPLAVLATPAYLAHWPFWCTTAFVTAIYAAVVAALFRLWRTNALR